MPLDCERKIEKRKQDGNVRDLTVHSPPIDFASNDYLGLSRCQHLTSLILQEKEEYPSCLNGWGSTGSRLLTGNSKYVQELEDTIASFHGYEAGLLFSCGYMANVGLLTAICNDASILLFDSGVHASVRDGIRLSKAKAFSFRHNDLNQLEERLRKQSKERKECFICIESIYSTDGSLSPLHEICHLSEKYGAHLIVDEAHAVGVFGPNGRGLVAQHQLNSYVFAQVVTCGKALGTYGAIVLGNQKLKHCLVNFATSFIYTTTLPFYLLAAIKCSYTLFPKMDSERNQLQKLIQMCKEKGRRSPTHIQAIPVQGNKAAKQAALLLLEKGYDVRPLLSPTVRRNHEVLRISLHAFNSENDLRHLLQFIRERGIYA